MSENKAKRPEVADAAKLETTDKPLIFISHDARDAELAEAFAKLLTNVSADVLKSFRSSDKTGRQGIDFGVEWYPELMKQLETASDVVCLLTPRSTGRPWILYEAGVAKGKLNTPVHGIALGIPLLKAITGPFAQFQNLEDDEESLTKLVMQLVGRIPRSAPDHDAIVTQIRIFKEQTKKILAKAGQAPETGQDQAPDDNAIAKMFEEIKVMFGDLPSRVESSLSETERSPRRRRPFRFHPMMIEEMTHMFGGKGGDPSIALLVLPSFYRDDFPWLYEIGVEAYRASKAGDTKRAREAIQAFQRVAEFTAYGPFMDEFGSRDKESHMMLMELPHMVENFTRRLWPSSVKKGEEEPSRYQGRPP